MATETLVDDLKINSVAYFHNRSWGDLSNPNCTCWSKDRTAYEVRAHLQPCSPVHLPPLATQGKSQWGGPRLCKFHKHWLDACFPWLIGEQNMLAPIAAAEWTTSPPH